MFYYIALTFPGKRVYVCLSDRERKAIRPFSQKSIFPSFLESIASTPYSYHFLNYY